jgi:dihydroflavonol-4-reductase
MKRYLVTGATGHLGMTIIQQLSEQSQCIRALVMPNDPLTSHLPSNIEVVYGNVVDKDSLLPFFENKTNDHLVVIHCAGIVSIASRYSQKMYDVNVTGTKNITDLCLAHSVAKLIYISSVHAIEEKPNREPISEVKKFDPKKVVGAYAKTKAEATQYVIDHAHQGVDVCVIHPSGLVGPNDYGRSHVTQLILDFYQGRLTAAVAGGYDFVDVRDVAAGIITCVEKGEDGETYLLSNQYYSVKEFLEYLHRITNKKRVTLILPQWFVKLTAPLAELYYKLRKQPPLYTAYSLYTLVSNSTFNHQKASEKLAYHSRPMEETLRDTIAWLREQKRL